MKRILSLILAAAMIAALLAACGSEDTDGAAVKDETAPTADVTEKAEQEGEEIPEYPAAHTLYFKDSQKSAEVVANFFNSDSGAKADVVMTKVSEDADAVTFSCEGDCSLYNMVTFTCDGEAIRGFTEVAFNPCSGGWYRTEDDLLPYIEGSETDYRAAYDHVKLTGYGYEKNIYIWTPDGYDPASDEKYATVYMLDGQGMLFFGWDYQQLRGCPVVNTQIEAMAAATGHKAIVVAIESDVARGNELIPRFAVPYAEAQYGSQEYDCMDGTQFADFVANTLAPYVREHYNVYPDALHTAIAGGSFGGLEAFYITVEYPEVFGTAGALSPSLFVHNDEAWTEYLRAKTFDDNSPFLYIYTGGENDTDKEGEVTAMVERLQKLGYPADKVAYHYYDEGVHSSFIWRNVFSEFLTAMVFRRVAPLEK